MSPKATSPSYRVLPLPVVQREARKLLTAEQCREGIAAAKMLRFYPLAPDLDVKTCGDGLELRIEGRSINRQGGLRAIFWVHERSHTIYIVDLFWKKTNRVSMADKHRMNHRIRQLKAVLAVSGDPWKSGQ